MIGPQTPGLAGVPLLISRAALAFANRASQRQKLRLIDLVNGFPGKQC